VEEESEENQGHGQTVVIPCESHAMIYETVS